LSIKLQRLQVFKGVEWLYFFLFLCFIFVYSLLISFQEYTLFTQYDDTIVEGSVLLQYKKTKHARTYDVLKIILDNGTQFYTTAPLKTANIQFKHVKLWLLTKKLTFYDYMHGFYLPSKILAIDDVHDTLKEFVKKQHTSTTMQELYSALFFAAPISQHLRQIIASYGVAHLIAISGFHLGILSLMLFFILKPFMQKIYIHCCPYRDFKRDSFFVVSVILFIYMYYLHFPPSLLRAFTMMLIGFFLYDRGFKIVSFQTLFISVLVLVALIPQLVFSLGFFLSVMGVFYIFLFLQYFEKIGLKNRILEFISLSIFIYFAMLPYSLYFFHTFSIYHILSIIVSMLFTLFYPLMLILHIFGYGGVFDSYLLKVPTPEVMHITISKILFYSYVVFSLMLAVCLMCRFKKKEKADRDGDNSKG